MLRADGTAIYVFLFLVGSSGSDSSGPSARLCRRRGLGLAIVVGVAGVVDHHVMIVVPFDVNVVVPVAV